MMQKSLLIVAALAAASPAWAQLDVSALAGLEAKAEESVVVTLDATMLQLAGGLLSQGKGNAETLRNLVSGLQSITVRSFEFKEDGQYSAADVAPIQSQLEAPGWSRIITVRESGSPADTQIYTRTAGGSIVGLTIIAAEARELTVVSIDGPINLEDLAALGGSFGIPNLPGVSKGGGKGGSSVAPGTSEPPSGSKGKGK